MSVTLCGLPVAESVNTRADDLPPGALGVNVTWTVQDALLATEPPQRSVPFVNCVESPPVTAILEKVTVAPVWFVKVMVCAALVAFGRMLPKAIVAGLTVTGRTPCPVITKQSGELAALLGTQSVACSCVVVVEGVKVTRIGQDEFGVTVTPVQPAAKEKSS